MRRIGLIGGLGGFHSADPVLRSVDVAEVEALQVAGDRAEPARRYVGCTELSMLLDPTDPTAAAVPLLDSTALHVTALLDAALAPPAAAHQTLSPEEGAA